MIILYSFAYFFFYTSFPVGGVNLLSLLVPSSGLATGEQSKFFSYYIPKPYLFVNKSLKSNLDILNIITDLNSLLPQLADFINQFNNVVNQSGINVITDITGNMSIDVPRDMPDSVAKNITNRIGIIDRLITTRGQEINELLQKGLNVENKLKMENPEYVSQLSEKIAEFRRLNALYRH
jgi:hypothetical protein